MAPGKQDMANQEGKTGSAQKTVSYKIEQSAKPGRLCNLRLPLFVLALLLTAGVAHGATVGEVKIDMDAGLVAIRAPGHRICYIVDKEPGESDWFVLSVDESRGDRPVLSGELEAFCLDLDPRFAATSPVEKGGGSDGQVVAQRHGTRAHRGEKEEE